METLKSLRFSQKMLNKTGLIPAEVFTGQHQTEAFNEFDA
jgi:hypothetical protein